MIEPFSILNFNVFKFIDDNTGPSQCEEIRVFLKDLPTFTRLQVRENVTFECTVVGNKVAQQFTWFKNGAVRYTFYVFLIARYGYCDLAFITLGFIMFDCFTI